MPFCIYEYAFSSLATPSHSSNSAHVWISVSSSLTIKVLAFLSQFWLKERTFLNSQLKCCFLSFRVLSIWQKDLLGLGPKEKEMERKVSLEAFFSHHSAAHHLSALHQRELAFHAKRSLLTHTSNSSNFLV